MKLKAILQSIRFPFLILTPVCVLLGISIVVFNQHNVDSTIAILIMLGALSAHISVNTLNEYLDFKSGLDLITQKTKFSGGSGALPGNPEAAMAVLTVGVASLVITIIIGIFFIWKYGTAILPIGIIGIVLIATYTQWINKHPILCLIAPGIGFGFLMIAGTQFILEGKYDSLSWLIALVPFFLVNNLLLLNQYPDIDSDTSVGRNHFPIAFGITRSNIVYAVFAGAPILLITTYVLINYLPASSLMALLPMPLAFFALSGAIKYGRNIGHHTQYLGANVAVTLLTPLILALTIM